MTWRSEALDPRRHRVAEFESGEPSLDVWLRELAGGAEARRVARTFVWCDAGDEIAGYDALAAHRLVRDDLQSSVGRGSPTEVPAVLLARLALCRRLHGQRLGGALLADANGLRRSGHGDRRGSLVVVDALDDSAARSYEHHGFRRIRGTLRQAQKVSDVAAALG